MEPVRVKRTNVASSIVVSIPHGSSQLTAEMNAMRKPEVILANTDWFLNELYAFLEELSVTSVSATFSRYVIDVNRSLSSGGEDGDDAYTKSLVYRKTTFGKALYVAPLPAASIVNRIETIYRPFHRCLTEEIDEILQRKETVYLFDLHSFYIQSTADVVLGTCAGRSCSDAFMKLVYDAFAAEGFVVKVDEQGLTGGHIVSHYGAFEHVEAIQIELRYTAYIDQRAFGEEEVETRNEPLFRESQARLFRVFQELAGKLREGE